VAAAGVIVLSYLLLLPVRNLAAATRRIAAGDLHQQIPVQSRDELGELTAAFNDMVTNLAKVQDELIRSEKLISLGRLSAGVAHEIRNPLNAIKGAIVHLQRRRAADPLITEYTHLVAEEIDRLNTFVSEFLLFARQSPPKRAPTDLNLLVAGVVGLLADQAAACGVALVQDLAPDLPPVPLDARQIEQVIVNLLINAMDALPGGGQVILATALDERREPHLPIMAKLSVMDNGTGIADGDRKNIFDPFFSTKDGGTGLGLPISLGIVENHGGTLEVESHPGQGTRMTVLLPLKAEGPKTV
jgi:signal transduction histidine kinase